MSSVLTSMPNSLHRLQNSFRASSASLDRDSLVTPPFPVAPNLLNARIFSCSLSPLQVNISLTLHSVIELTKNANPYQDPRFSIARHDRSGSPLNASTRSRGSSRRLLARPRRRGAARPSGREAPPVDRGRSRSLLPTDAKGLESAQGEARLPAAPRDFRRCERCRRLAVAGGEPFAPPAGPVRIPWLGTAPTLPGERDRATPGGHQHRAPSQSCPGFPT